MVRRSSRLSRVSLSQKTPLVLDPDLLAASSSVMGEAFVLDESGPQRGPGGLQHPGAALPPAAAPTPSQMPQQLSQQQQQQLAQKPSSAAGAGAAGEGLSPLHHHLEGRRSNTGSGSMPQTTSNPGAQTSSVEQTPQLNKPSAPGDLLPGDSFRGLNSSPGSRSSSLLRAAPEAQPTRAPSTLFRVSAGGPGPSNLGRHSGDPFPGSNIAPGVAGGASGDGSVRLDMRSLVSRNSRGTNNSGRLAPREDPALDRSGNNR